MTEAHRTDEIQGEIVHVYDGIEEADNALPRWWLAVLFLSILFAIGYWFYYEQFHIGPSAAELYAKSLEEAATQGGDVTNQALMTLAQNPAAVEAGKQEFALTCLPCHEAQGQGKIGPNLTDNQWIHGGSALEIHDLVQGGVPEKGMPAWGPILGPEKLKNVTAFVLSIRNTHVAGKAPEGDVYTGP